MITQHTLHPHRRKMKKRVGRGDASGHGSFSTRGGKGQTARSGGTRRPGFSGGQTPLVRLMPKFRGFKNPRRAQYQIIPVSALNVFDDGASVDIIQLYEKKLIHKKNLPIKILGDGELERKLNLVVDATSKSAKEKIEAKGGTVAFLGKKS